jgi:hypothetical protein
MRLALFFSTFLLVTSMTANAAEPASAPLPAPPALSEAAQQRLAPLYDAYENLSRELAALPPADTDTERLLRLRRVDELGRSVYRQIDFVSLPVAEGRAAVQAAQLEIERWDIENQKALKAMLPPRGWFLKSEIGADALLGAWEILRHAINSDIAWVRSVIANLATMLDAADVDKAEYAMLADRVAVVDGVRQTYGTQVICHEFKWMLYPIADENGVDARRKDMGIEITVAQQMAQFATRSCPIAQYAGHLPQ